MNERERRKAAIEEFKKKMVSRGIYAIRHIPSGQLWIGASPNLEAARNREWFALRQGLHENKSLHSVWAESGEQAFAFEILETLDPDLAQMLVHDTLKARLKHWMEKTGGLTVSGF
ncbi:MAG: GIY-YIG nuclease family protein [Acidobacteria bacterium]|nr:GIY-YIG nuclease family protein [Acidobacteriota bacterium]